MDYDPQEHARELYRENLWLRELITAAAQELERLASHRPDDSRSLLDRAQRLRRRLHEGLPRERASFYPSS